MEKKEQAKKIKLTQYQTNGTTPDRIMARVVTIEDIKPIDGANAIELCYVMGWQCVAKKDEFKIGDLCIYVSIDSLLDPTNPNFSFFEGKCLKTKVIRGALSQGLIGPLKWIVDIIPELDLKTLKVGDDVTALLKIKKYVPNDEKYEYDDTKKNSEILKFPSFVPKTDEERVQNITNILPKLIGKDVVITRKEDGTSTTFISYLKPQQNDEPCQSNERTFTICGRNIQLITPDSSNQHYFAIEKKFNIKDGMFKLGKNIAIQGEIVGPKINGNKLMLTNLDFRVFNIYDIENGYYLPWNDVIEITNILGLNRVPEIYKGVFSEQLASVDELLKMVDTLEYNQGVPAEGMVIKTDYGLDQPRISFKVISNKFLLHHKQ
jgi:RNA ligase (TIGR02306 family)